QLSPFRVATGHHGRRRGHGAGGVAHRHIHRRQGASRRRLTLVLAITVVGSWPGPSGPAELEAETKDVIGMRGLVVYESMYGSTRVIASHIADGLRADYEVTLVPMAEATAELVAGADLLVVGAPTHMHGLPSAASRQRAALAAARDGSRLRLEPD